MLKKLAFMGLVFATSVANAQQNRSDILVELKTVADPLVIRQRLKALGTGNEQERWAVMEYYERNKDLRRADSILQATVIAFPLGQLAYIQLANKIVSESDVAKKEKIAAKLLQDFPNADKDRIHHSLAYGYATAKNIPKVIENINALSSQRAKFSATLIVAKVIVNYDLAAAESLIRTQIDEVVKAGVPAAPIRVGDTGARGDARPSYFLFLEMYANILVKMGKYDEALKYARDVYVESGGKKDEVTGNYALSLSKTGNHKEALPLLEKIISDGKSTEAIKLAFKQSYSYLNPGKDATAYLSNLENYMKGKVEAEVAKMMINDVSPNFSVKDINGKTVALADFKGKTIVIDFWATWCMPCIGSFPAMQMAVDKYKADPNVKFLFIHTWERAEDPLQDARTFLAGNGYRFDLYIDAKDPKTKVNSAVTAFGARGIPAKFVVDGKGKIRFKMTGFSGGNEAAVAELSAMIEMIKKAS